MQFKTTPRLLAMDLVILMLGQVTRMAPELSRHPESVTKRKILSPDEIAYLLREFSENKLDGGELFCCNLDSDEDKRLSETDCEESEESATEIDNIPVNPDVYVTRKGKNAVQDRKKLTPGLTSGHKLLNLINLTSIRSHVLLFAGSHQLMPLSPLYQLQPAFPNVVHLRPQNCRYSPKKGDVVCLVEF
ncbi:uncharacterized protein TNCV_1665441 [Trichonephila clavipes]|nr:uncharacterized protein TNCV_1665441 [Trichonephila clavipes]